MTAGAGMWGYERTPGSDAERWRETVRDIYDLVHLEGLNHGDHNATLAMEVAHLIEQRHPAFFGAEAP